MRPDGEALSRISDPGIGGPGGLRQLGIPAPVDVRAGADGQPLVVDGQAIDSVRDTWLLEDRWWTDQPLRRRYWELVTTDGRNLVVFRDIHSGSWWVQR